MKVKLIVVSIFLVGTALLLQQCGSQMVSTYTAKTKYSPSKTPGIYLIPEPLTDSSRSAAASTITNSYCVFSTPWTNPTLVRDSTNIVLYSYPNEVKVIMLASGSSTFGAEHFRRMVEMDEDRKKLEHLFETSNLQSNYDFLNACFQATPDQISLFSSKADATQKLIFLILKSVMIPLSDVQACYRYDIDGIKGFQFGDPTIDKSVHLICFTSPDLAVEFRVGCSKATVQQEDINCIIGSVKNNANNKGIDAHD